MKKVDIPALTCLRGIAALLIIIHHTSLIMLPLANTQMRLALGRCGQLGMTLFFVLSGFVIHYNYGQRISQHRWPEIVKFVWARIARLYPLYLIFVLGNFALNMHLLKGAERLATVYAFPFNLIGVQSWFYAVIGTHNLSVSQLYASVAWSISTELFLYFLFIPLACLFNFSKSSVRRGVAVVIIAMTGRLITVWIANRTEISGWMENHWGMSQDFGAAHWLIYYSPYSRWFEFLAGVGLSQIFLSTHTKYSSGKTVHVLGCIGLLYIGASFIDGTLINIPALFSHDKIYVGYAIATPLVLYWTCVTRHLTTALVQPLYFLGGISYPLYLLHLDLMTKFRLSAHGSFGYMIAKTTAYLVTTIVVAWLVHQYYEMPMKNWLMARFHQWFAARKQNMLSNTLSRDIGG